MKMKFSMFIFSSLSRFQLKKLTSDILILKKSKANKKKNFSIDFRSRQFFGTKRLKRDVEYKWKRDENLRNSQFYRDKNS